MPRQSPLHSKSNSGSEECPQTNKHRTDKLIPDSSPSVKEFGKPPKRDCARGRKTPKFSKANNHQLVKSALGKVCLAGELNKKQREEAFEIIGKLPGNVNTIVLFKDTTETRQDFKALYTYDDEEGVVEQVCGLKDAPSVLEEDMVQNFFRYDSGAKEFKKLQGNRCFSLAVDAVSLKPSVVRKKSKY